MTGKPEPWFDKARGDLEMARRAMMPPEPLPDMACYHAQQCAEKYLKGYLIAQRIEFRWVHDLLYLTQLSQECNPEFETLLDAVDVLNAYATRVRYPVEETPDPELEEAEEAFRLAERVAQFIENKIRS